MSAQTVGPVPVYTLVQPKPGRRTYCVLGVPRGGTSMISGLLIQLGVHMGDKLAIGNLEDEEFQSHQGKRKIFSDPDQKQSKSNFLADIREIVERRNATYDTWGWKDPLASYYVSDIDGTLRNPHYIFVTRDIGAVATRENQFYDNESDFRTIVHLKNAVHEYSLITDFLGRRKPPSLLVSYERALRHPKAAAAAIAQFIGTSKNELGQKKLQDLADYIQPERGTAELGSVGPRRVEDSTIHFPTDHEWSNHIVEGTDWDRGSFFWTDLEATYAKATQAAHAGDYAASSFLSSGILEQLALSFDELKGGAQELERLIIREPDRATSLPQIVTGCLNMLGVANLNNGNPSAACDLFSAGFALAKVHVDRIGLGASISFDLLWWMALHAAISGQRCGRELLVQRFCSLLKEAAENDKKNQCGSKASEMFSRAQSELKLTG